MLPDFSPKLAPRPCCGTALLGLVSGGAAAPRARGRNAVPGTQTAQCLSHHPPDPPRSPRTESQLHGHCPRARWLSCPLAREGAALAPLARSRGAQLAPTPLTSGSRIQQVHAALKSGLSPSASNRARQAAPAPPRPSTPPASVTAAQHSPACEPPGPQLPPARVQPKARPWPSASPMQN